MTTPLNNLTDTWNNGATVFYGLKYNITNTASAAGSLLCDFQLGGVSQFNVDKAGGVNIPGQLILSKNGAFGSPSLIWSADGSSIYRDNSIGGLTFTTPAGPILNLATGTLALTLDIFALLRWGGGASFATPDLILARDAAGIFAQRNSTNAQTLRVYNTYTDASNYERGVIDWTTTSNVLTIGVQVGGTGNTGRTLSLTCGTDVYINAANAFASNQGIKMSPWTGGLSHYFGSGTNTNFNSVNIIGWVSNNNANTGTLDLGIARSAAGVIAFGDGSSANANATILAKTKAGAPSTSDVSASTWALIRDTTNSTTKFYYNNAGTLQSLDFGSVGLSNFSSDGTTLSGSAQTVTTNKPVLDLTQTWNASGTTFTGLKFNITNTASAAASRPIDFQIGGQSFFRSNTDGSVFVDQQFGGLTGITFSVGYQGTQNFTVSYQGTLLVSGAAASLGFANVSSSIYKISWGGLTEIYSPSAGIIEARQSTVAGTLRVYNTYTDASNYERGVFDWTTTSNTLTIGTQALGTGTSRQLRLQSVSGTIDFSDGTGNVPTIGILSSSRMIFNQNTFCTGTFFPAALSLDNSNGDTTLARGSAGVFKFASANSMTANGSVATTMTSLGPSGAHTTIQEWLTIQNSAGTVRYIPCY